MFTPIGTCLWIGFIPVMSETSFYYRDQDRDF